MISRRRWGPIGSGRALRSGRRSRSTLANSASTPSSRPVLECARRGRERGPGELDELPPACNCGRVGHHLVHESLLSALLMGDRARRPVLGRLGHEWATSGGEVQGRCAPPRGTGTQSSPRTENGHGGRELTWSAGSASAEPMHFVISWRVSAGKYSPARASTR